MKRLWVQDPDDFIFYYKIFVFICLMKKKQKTINLSLYQSHEKRQNAG